MRPGGNLAVKGGRLSFCDASESGLSLSGQRPSGSISSAASEMDVRPGRNPAVQLASNGTTSSIPAQSTTMPSDSQRLKTESRHSKSDTSTGTSSSIDRYWKTPVINSGEDVVLIHVCDENRQVSKDFCCKRNILVKHMRYFERFLAESENGYDDIDISVHCDVEIFEWLMTYIHEPDKPPVLDKAIVVSILISSEFLQMDTLVDLCLEHVAGSLGEIIRLPIDLSCISDKLINKLAMLTPPKTLAQTKDRKDKILSKLYKRRVELDFSRKSGARGGSRTIAASLTCCRYCGGVYLDSWVSLLACPLSPPAVDFRGSLARRHCAIASWSLTSYLKTLHAGGMGWDAIYWHVWGACEVFMGGGVMVSALDVNRYTVDHDGMTIMSRPKDAEPTSGLPPRPATHQYFTLDIDEDASRSPRSYKLLIAQETTMLEKTSLSLLGSPFSNAHTGSSAQNSVSLHGAGSSSSAVYIRPTDVLPAAVHDLLNSQAKLISGAANKALIESTAKHMIAAASQVDDLRPFDYGEALWAEGDAARDGGPQEEGEKRGRSRSPPRAARKVSQSLSLPKGRTRGCSPQVLDVSNPSAGQAASGIIEGSDGGQVGTPSNGTDKEGVHQSESVSALSAPAQSSGSERRSRSMGSSARKNTAVTGSRRGRPTRGDPSPSSGSPYPSESDPTTMKQLALLRAIPPDIFRKQNSSRGPVHGVWLVPHPLRLYPSTYADLLNIVQESPLSDSKKLEWELDLLREYDEKRLDAFESLLVSRRSAGESQHRSASVTKSVYYKQGAGKDAKKDAKEPYYKDKGRQASKTGIVGV